MIMEMNQRMRVLGRYEIEMAVVGQILMLSSRPDAFSHLCLSI